MRPWVAYLLAVTSALGFATLGIFALLGYAQHLSTITMLVWRFAGAALVFALWVLIGRHPWPRWRDLLLLAGMRAIGYTGMSWLFLVANRMAPVGLVSAALYTYPAIVTMVLGALGWEKLTRQRMFAVAATTAGAALVVLRGRFPRLVSIRLRRRPLAAHVSDHSETTRTSARLPAASENGGRVTTAVTTSASQVLNGAQRQHRSPESDGRKAMHLGVVNHSVRARRSTEGGTRHATQPPLCGAEGTSANHPGR